MPVSYDGPVDTGPTADPNGEPFTSRYPTSGTVSAAAIRRALPASQVLVADDDPVSRTALAKTLRTWGHEVITARDGNEAWAVLQRAEAPPLAVLDWMMPGVEGPEICRRVRLLERPVPTYLILLTARDFPHDVVAGLNSGADDYVTKPFDRHELRSRLQVGERIVALQRGLADRIKELEQALSQVKQLKGLLPICGYCKKVRDDQNYWQQVETYVAAHSNARFTHGICPGCWHGVVKQELEENGLPTE